MPDKDGNPSRKDIEALSKRAINGRNAYLCCVKGRADATGTMMQLLDEIKDAVNAPPGTKTKIGLTMAPEVRPTNLPRVDYIGKPFPMPGTPWGLIIGIVTAAGVLSEHRADEQAVEALQATMAGVATRIRQKSMKDCYGCVKKHMFGQDKDRKNVVAKGLPHGPDPNYSNPMRIRVHHD